LSIEYPNLLNLFSDGKSPSQKTSLRRSCHSLQSRLQAKMRGFQQAAQENKVSLSYLDLFVNDLFPFNTLAEVYI
jgi:hypothetical protein